MERKPIFCVGLPIHVSAEEKHESLRRIEKKLEKDYYVIFYTNGSNDFAFQLFHVEFTQEQLSKDFKDVFDELNGIKINQSNHG
jgi:hypothetical protein